MNVCAGITLLGRTRIDIFDQTVDSELFRSILKRSIFPDAKRLLEANWQLYMDNDPKHKSKMALKFIAENQVQLVNPPPNSPDLNPLENVWSVLDTILQEIQPTNKNSLKEAIKRGWRKLDQNLVQKCIESLPTRLSIVREEEGGHTKY